MPRKAGKVPSYCRHKHSGRAVVRIDGHDYYLGPYGSLESHSLYARLIAGWQTSSVLSTKDGAGAESNATQESVSVNELILGYCDFADSYYRSNGEPTGEIENIRRALYPLRHLYGELSAAEFGPKLLKALRQHMIQGGRLSRGVINQRVGAIKRMFSWAVAEELVPPDVIAKLRELKGLKSGKTEARETDPVRPVPDLHVALTLQFVSPQVAAMIKLQRLTGMRPGEVVQLRSTDIDMGGGVWIYEPPDHKNSWRGQKRSIAIGPEAQRVMTPFLDRQADSYLFSSTEAECWRYANRPPYQGRPRRTPIYPSELRRRERIKLERRRKPNLTNHDQYDTDSYRRAIKYGIRRAKKIGILIPPWSPNQLRHNRATEVRQRHGLEAAQVVLGHNRANVTEIYAERDLALAASIAAQTG